MATRRRRNVRDETDALALLQELESSGLELPEFCALQKVDGRSLSCWRRKLWNSAGLRSLPQPLRLIEVVTAEPDLRTPAAYKLTVGQVRIEVGDDFRDATLTRLLRAAAAC